MCKIIAICNLIMSDWVFNTVCVCQMGGPAYNNQFMAHSGPRGPPGMAPGGMGPGPGPNRGPPSMGPMYGPAGGPQRVPQHPNYGPGPQQGHMRPPHGLKRPYNSEVRAQIKSSQNWIIMIRRMEVTENIAVSTSQVSLSENSV